MVDKLRKSSQILEATGHLKFSYNLAGVELVLYRISTSSASAYLSTKELQQLSEFLIKFSLLLNIQK